MPHYHFCGFGYYNGLSTACEEEKIHLTQFQRETHICYHMKYKYLLYFRHTNWISIKTFSSPDVGNCSQKGYWLPCTNAPVLVLTTLSACFSYHDNIFSKTQSVACHLHNHCTFTILNSHSITFIQLPMQFPLQHINCCIHLNFWSKKKKPETRNFTEPHADLKLLSLLLETHIHPSIYSRSLDVGFVKHQSSVTQSITPPFLL